MNYRDRMPIFHAIGAMLCIFVLAACARKEEAEAAVAEQHAQEAKERQVEAETKAKAAYDRAENAEKRADEANRTATEAMSSRWGIIAGAIVLAVIALLAGIAIGSSARKTALPKDDPRN